MNRALVAFIFLLLLAYDVAADIRGKVKDHQDNPLPGAVVMLMDSAQHQVIKSEVAGADGSFSIVFEKAGSYYLQVNAAGYTAFSRQLRYNGNDLDVAGITLSVADRQLSGVTVKASKPLIEVKGNKTIMNVESSISATGSTLFEMLQRAPGVSIDNNDNISLKGKQGVTIMVDGKPVPVQGTDLANLLKGMPATAIDQIELMSNPGAQYDAAGTAGIINLKTKKEKRQGYNGTAMLGGGMGIYPKSNGVLSMNFRTPAFNAYINASGTIRKGFNELDLDRNFIADGRFGGAYKQYNYAVINMQSYAINTGIDYNLGKKTIVGATVASNINAHTFAGDNKGRFHDSSDVYRSYFLSNNFQDNSSSSIAVNGNMRHSFDSAGHMLTADVDFAHYGINNSQDQKTNYFLADGNTERPYYLLQGTMKGYTEIYAFKTDYTRPLDAASKLEAGAKASFVTADNKPDFFDASSGTPVFDTSKSNHFIYKEQILAAYGTYSKDWTKWSLQAGVRYEHTLAEGRQQVDGQNFRRDYGQLFPNITVSYNQSQMHQWSLSLSRRIDRPDYQQLNPFKNYIDPTSIHQGNPYLSPSFSYSAELGHTFKGRFTTTFNFTHTTDVITQVIILDAGNITLVTDRNLAVNNVYSLSGNYPLQIRKWWSSMQSFNAYYSQYQGNLSNSPLRDGLPTVYLATNNTFTLPQNWTGEVNAWATSEQLYGYMYLRPMYAINLGLQKVFWDKKATVKASFTDIFRAQNPTGITSFSNYRETFVVTRDTRVFNLTFTYRFGNGKLQMQRRRASGAEEERRRAGGGSQSA